MQRVYLLTALVTLAAGRQPSHAEWMPGVASRTASLPPRNPDAEIIGPITDPRPALDGNFQVPRGHKLAGVYRNDKPRLPEDYVRYLREQGLTEEQIEHGEGLRGTRPVRTLDDVPAPANVLAPSPALVPAPAPGQMPLPGGLTLHLERDEPDQPPPRPPLPRADLYPAVQTIPSPSVDHLRSDVSASAARFKEVGVTPPAGRPRSAGRPSPPRPELPKLADLAGGHPRLEDLRRHHRRLKQKLDEQWKRQLRRHEEAVRRGRHRVFSSSSSSSSGGSGAPQVREEYHVRHLPGGGRSVSYSKHTTHTTTTHRRRGGQSSLRRSQRQQQQRRKRHHQFIRSSRQQVHRW